MHELIKGPIYEHSKTKELLHYLPSGSIVFLWHEDIDGVTVDGLKKAKVKAVVNGKASLSGKYDHSHVDSLITSGINVYDIEQMTREKWPTLHGEEAFIYQDKLFITREDASTCIGLLTRYTSDKIAQKRAQARLHYAAEYSNFVNNTIKYAKDEYEWFQQRPSFPKVLNDLQGKDVWIIARNTNYEKDIQAVSHALKRKEARIIAVDGAADGLLANRICPDYIIGDMDSISEEALQCGAHLICHEHPNGLSPGRDRLDKLTIKTDIIRFIGTSEDVAISAAYWAGAAHFYLIGCRIGMIEFLEKGRAGMSATWLARMQAGDRITDLKGIHQIVTKQTFVKKKSIKASWEALAHFVIGIWHSRQRFVKRKEVLRHD